MTRQRHQAWYWGGGLPPLTGGEALADEVETVPVGHAKAAEALMAAQDWGPEEDWSAWHDWLDAREGDQT